MVLTISKTEVSKSKKRLFMSSDGKKIGKYRILKRLAVGGMAEIYMAETPKTSGINKQVTIKRILPQYSNKPDFIEMFEKEAEICSNLQHSNIINIFDFGMDNDQFYLVMEYVKGNNLRQIINQTKKKRRPFPISHAVHIIQEAALGLDYAHRCIDKKTTKPLYIIHRDISPQNVMVSFEGEIKILDFGIAKAENKIESTRSGTLKGKFAYMSPEQVDGVKLDSRTDVFSLGTILWEMLTYRRLFKGSNEIESLKKIIKGSIPSVRKYNPNISSVLDGICQKALMKDRSLRYKSAADFQKDLNLFLNRTYPSFSKQDFSLFMKEMYTDEILKDQTAQQQQYMQQKNQDFSEKREDTELGTKIKKITRKPVRKPTRLKSLGSSPFPDSLHPYNQSSISHSQSTQISSSIKMNSPKSFSYNYTKQKKENRQWLFIFFVLLIVGAISYYLTQEKDSLSGLKNIVNSSLGKKSHLRHQSKRQYSSTTEVAKATLKYVVYINSQPQGSEIFIDDKATGLFTPSRISINGKKQIRLLLKKEHYLPYSQLLYISKTQSFMANMKRANLGYIDIEVTNGGKNLIVFVNRERVFSSVPILRYAIPAGKRVPIRVLNPITNVKASTTVRVKENERKTIHLILENTP